MERPKYFSRGWRIMKIIRGDDDGDCIVYTYIYIHTYVYILLLYSHKYIILSNAIGFSNTIQLLKHDSVESV
jgi:hypothetical protein